MGSDTPDSEKQGCTNLQVIMNMTRALVGVSTLTLPKAMARIGAIPGCIMAACVPLFALSALSWAVQLKKAHFMKGRQSPAQTTETDPLSRAESAFEASYSALSDDENHSEARGGDSCFGGFDLVVQQVFGLPGHAVFVGCIMLTQFNAGISYTVAMEEGFQVLFPSWSREFGLVCITACQMILTLLAPKLQNIAWISLLSAVVLLFIFVAMPIEGIHSHRQEKANDPLYLWHPAASFLDFGFAYGSIACSCFELAIGLCLYEDMQNKQSFSLVTGSSYSLSILLSAFFGVVGYWTFGSSVKELVYLNFPDGSTSSRLCIVSYNLILVASYLLMMMPVFLYVRDLFPSTPYSIIRCGLITVSSCLSKAMPSIMGATLLCTVIATQLSDLLIPALCYLRMGNRYHIFSRGIACLSIAVGVTGGTAGFLSALYTSPYM